MNYRLITSNNHSILLDEADYQKFLEVSPTGALVRMKRGIVNPSFVVAILPAEEITQKKVDGYIDEKTGNFVLTKETYEGLPDAFSDQKLLQ